MKKLLVTGGCGYIASHAAVLLLNAGYRICIFDNLSNSRRSVLDRIKEISGKDVDFFEGDLRSSEDLRELFQKHSFDGVLHFAGLKAVGESVEKPLDCYENNVMGSLQLFRAMERAACFKLVFSSSATVYGEPQQNPISENHPRRATNPYGQTKLCIEHILEDLCSKPKTEWRVASLRYFNPVGAHPSALIGEDPREKPNNLMPFITQVAVGKRKELKIFGDDYETPDGTGQRDYIHVMDLVEGHLSALKKLESQLGFEAYNLGTGRAYSVLELLEEFERACGKEIPHQVVERRPGDIAASWAACAKAEKKLQWRAQLGLAEMCRDSWNWQKKNPDGLS